ncbi:recombinase family protein [Paenibacillus jamilae]|nr:recombinase family protein [Paenibacillus jamilae]
MKKKDRGYVRVSTLKESQQDSPEHQESLIKEHALREGIELDHVYEDRDTATSIVKRSDVKRLIEDAKRGEIKSIWFASLSRFSRDALDAISLKRILVNALRIRVVSVEDNYDSEKKDDELLFGIKSVVNQNTSGDISISSRRGIRKSCLEKRNYIGSIAPYGYKKIKDGKRKTLDIVKDQSDTVGMMYDLYIDGLGDKMIVRYLNGENPNLILYPSYTGGLWSLSSVQTVLSNPVYTGYNVSGRYTTEIVYDNIEELMNRRKKLVRNPRSTWEWSKEKAHPEIIPLSKWEYVQDLREGRGKGKRGGKRTFVNAFAKSIFCSECGSAMVAMASIKNGKKYQYLLCSRRRRIGEKGCSNSKWIPYHEMRDDTIAEILRRIKSAVKAMESKGAAELSVSVPQNNYDKEKRKINKRIEDNRRLLFEIRRQHMLGEIEQSQYEFEKEQYTVEIDTNEMRLTEINNEEKRSFDHARLLKDAKKSLHELTRLESYAHDVDKTRILLMKVVRRIDVSANGDISIETYV